MRDVHSYSVSIVQHYLYKIAEEAFRYSRDTLPSGRARWFLHGNATFCSMETIDGEEIYGYTPIRSREELDFHEYGMILTQNGIFASWQTEEKDNEGQYKVFSCFCPFQGLWLVDVSKEKTKIRFYYPNGKIISINSQCFDSIENFLSVVNNMVQTGYTKDFHWFGPTKAGVSLVVPITIKRRAER